MSIFICKANIHNNLQVDAIKQMQKYETEYVLGISYLQLPDLWCVLIMETEL